MQQGQAGPLWIGAAPWVALVFHYPQCFGLLSVLHTSREIGVEFYFDLE